eukprot:gene20589-22620_t
MGQAKVDLGFVEDIESYKLASLFFPSKVGGKPAWLALKGIPNCNDLQCSNCGNLVKFLLQIYAPRDDIDECFHRMLYVFCCDNVNCCKKNDRTPFKIFRSQLARKNQFYDYEPSPADMKEIDVSQTLVLQREKWGNLCQVCGYPSSMQCSACKAVFYCSKDHQKLDWKEGHKSGCGVLKQNPKDQKFFARSSWNFPEFELVTESETDCLSHDDNGDEGNLQKDGDCVERNEEKLKMLLESGDNDESQRSFLNQFKETEDKHFQKFKKITAIAPDQVLRYSYDGEPLWVSAEHIPNASDIPNCCCGSKRIFEFQILPQLLNHLGVDSLQQQSIDWGTLAVYSCAKNCQPQSEYITEFAWKQDFSDSSNANSR